MWGKGWGRGDEEESSGWGGRCRKAGERDGENINGGSHIAWKRCFWSLNLN